MKRYRIKIVPDAEPNADGVWKDITDVVHPIPVFDTPKDRDEFYAMFAPPGFHVVQLEEGR